MAEGAVRDQLIDDHMGLVRGIAGQVHKSVGGQVEFDDLVSLGTAGLLEAVARFDPSSGHAFSTYGYYRIRGAMYDGLRRMAHLPRGEYQKLRRQERAGEYLKQASAADEAARSSPAAVRGPEQELRAMYEAMQGVATVFVTSLQERAEQGDQFADDTLATPDEGAHLQQLRGDLQAAIASLPDRERHFIEKHYLEDMTLQDAGQALGMSKSWASRLHARAIDRLKKRLRQHAPA